MDTESFIGEIAVVAFNFAPRGWAICAGQVLPISQNVALFSLLGTTYGGNGQTTFALPDLSGRTPVGAGNGPGLTPVVPGEAFGQEQVTLLTPEVPAHRHQLTAGSTADAAAPGGAGFAATTTASYRSGTGGGSFRLASLPVAGGNQPHENRQPYLALTFVIALQGVYPQRP